MTRRLGFVALAAAVGVVVVIIVIILPMIMIRLHPPDARKPGEWRFSHVVDSGRWPVAQRILDDSHEYTIVEAPAGSTCVVSTSRTAPVPDADAASHPVRIGPRTGSYVGSPDTSPEIVWSYAPDGTAVARCSEGVPEQTLLDLAEQVAFVDSRVRLPFMITSLPDGYHVASIDERRDGAEIRVTLTPEAALEQPSVIISYGSGQPSNRCLTTGANPVCLTASWSAEELPSAASRVRRSLDEVAGRLEIVSDPGDRATWYDAIDLPH